VTTKTWIYKYYCALQGVEGSEGVGKEGKGPWDEKKEKVDVKNRKITRTSA
jgi:hypothetical protein